MKGERVKFCRWLLPWMLAAGCAVAPQPPTQAPTAPPLPREWYAERENVYSVIAERSKILIYVYRGGPFARLGHNHVIRAGDLTGLIHVTDDLSVARADLSFSAAGLEIDPIADREAAGPDFATTLSDSDLKATRNNLLGHALLDAANHPFIRVQIRPVRREGRSLDLLAQITLKGVTHIYEDRAQLSISGGRIELTGSLAVAQTDFGITPLSILGGAVRVKDEVRIGYRLHAILISGVHEPEVNEFSPHFREQFVTPSNKSWHF